MAKNSTARGRTAFPIPRADGHRQSETAHEILHGENLRVRAAFPLIRTRGNRPFRSRGERVDPGVRCNAVPIDSVRSSPLPFYSSVVACWCSLSPSPRPMHAAFRAAPSLAAADGRRGSYLMYGTPPSSAGRTVVRLVFDADRSPLSCGSDPPPHIHPSTLCTGWLRILGQAGAHEFLVQPKATEEFFHILGIPISELYDRHCSECP